MFDLVGSCTQVLESNELQQLILNLIGCMLASLSFHYISNEWIIIIGGWSVAELVSLYLARSYQLR